MTAVESSQENVGKYLIIVVIKAIHTPDVIINADSYMNQSHYCQHNHFTLSPLAPNLNTVLGKGILLKLNQIMSLLYTKSSNHLTLS